MAYRALSISVRGCGLHVAYAGLESRIPSDVKTARVLLMDGYFVCNKENAVYLRHM